MFHSLLPFSVKQSEQLLPLLLLPYRPIAALTYSFNPHMHARILSISEVDSPARALDYDYGYEMKSFSKEEERA